MKWADGTIGGSMCIVLYAKFLVHTKSVYIYIRNAPITLFPVLVRYDTFIFGTYRYRVPILSLYLYYFFKYWVQKPKEYVSVMYNVSWLT